MRKQVKKDEVLSERSEIIIDLGGFSVRQGTLWDMQKLLEEHGFRGVLGIIEHLYTEQAVDGNDVDALRNANAMRIALRSLWGQGKK